MKTEFKLELGKGDAGAGHELIAKIIGTSPKDAPYVAVYASGLSECTQASGWIADKDLERFAVNILKAIKSDKLAQPTTNRGIRKKKPTKK